jgi:hypothetical protein
MERELWPRLYHLVMDAGSEVRQVGVTYQPHLVLLVLLWAALHDRPRRWACDEKNWSTTTLRPARIPSDSTLSRRLDDVAVGCLMRIVAARVRATQDPRLVLILDAKPLPVGGASRDPDARCGRAAGLTAKGYKLYAVWTNRPMPETYRVEPRNASENKVAEDMMLDLRGGGGYLLGDGEYDASPAYDAAGAAGDQRVAPREDPEAGLGHCYQSPYRRRGIALLATSFGQDLFRIRGQIEHSFGGLTSFGGGLSPLPAWVRGLGRVPGWVWAKLLINGARIMRNKRLTA